MTSPRQAFRTGQQGAATLVVVMVLFFIVALVGAYTNRNLIFEQRTSVNQYRSSQALEAAEAGAEWALALLNHGLISPICEPLGAPAAGATSFRQRYVITDPANGNLTPKPRASGAPLLPSCVLNGGQWACSCPSDADPVLAVPVGPEVAPAFRVRFEQIGPVPVAGPPSQPGVLRLRVVGCTRLNAVCLDFDGQGQIGEGRSVVTLLVAMTGNAVGAPTAALVVRRDVTLQPGAALAAYNAEPAGSGLAIQTGGDLNAGGWSAHGIPGAPSSQAWLRNDLALALVAMPPFSTDERMFAAVFNARPDAFREQPAAVLLPCPGGPCSAEMVRDVIALNPGRPVWVSGGLAAGSNVGSAAEPALLIVNGSLSFTAAGVSVHGLVYVNDDDWTTAGAGLIRGAVVARRDVGGNGAPTIVYDDDVLRRVRFGIGSFVRVPGSWKDFQ